MVHQVKHCLHKIKTISATKHREVFGNLRERLVISEKHIH